MLMRDLESAVVMGDHASWMPSAGAAAPGAISTRFGPPSGVRQAVARRPSMR